MKKQKLLFVLNFIKYTLLLFTITILISGLAVLIALACGMSVDNAALIAALAQSAVGAVAASFVIIQLRLGNETDAKNSRINEAEFILNYNMAFINDPNMCYVEHTLEAMMEKRIKNPKNIICDENRQSFVNYLVYLEGLASLIFKGVLTFESIDDLMAYRFFLAVNNPVLQDDQLFPYPEYFLGCFKLYEAWKLYRLKKGLPILQKETGLDLWENYERYAKPDVKVEALSGEDDLSVVAKLIYDTDPYIYPTAFGNGKTGYKNIKKLLINGCGYFDKKNILVAKRGGEILGIALSVKAGGATFNADVTKALPEGFADVNKRYFGSIDNSLKTYDASLYIACICVSSAARGQGVGFRLIKTIVNEHRGERLLLDVLSENKTANDLYKLVGFKPVVSEADGYSNGGTPPKVNIMVREPDPDEDNKTEIE